MQNPLGQREKRKEYNLRYVEQIRMIREGDT